MIHESKTHVHIVRSTIGDTMYWYTGQVPIKLMKLNDNLQAVFCIPEVFDGIGEQLEFYVVSALHDKGYSFTRSINTKGISDILVIIELDKNKQGLSKFLAKCLNMFLHENSIVLNSNYKVYWRTEHEFYTRQGPTGDYQIPDTKTIELQEPLYSSDNLEETIGFISDFCHSHELYDLRETHKLKQLIGLDKYSSCVLNGGFDRPDQILMTKSYSFSRRNKNE